MLKKDKRAKFPVCYGLVNFCTTKYYNRDAEVVRARGVASMERGVSSAQDDKSKKRKISVPLLSTVKIASLSFTRSMGGVAAIDHKSLTDSE